MHPFDLTDPSPVVNYLGHELRDVGRDEDVELLKTAECSLYHLGSDSFGTNVGLRIALPHQVYRRNRVRLRDLEANLLLVAAPSLSPYEDVYLGQVRIVAQPVLDDSWRGGIEQPVVIAPSVEQSIWKEGYFRLFLSHRPALRGRLEALRSALDPYGIAVFIAHTEIEPNQEWQGVIEQGLQTCDALVAFHDDTFHESVWCQQEVGWALGRGIFVQSVIVSSDPLGFLAYRQGLRLDLENVEHSAYLLATTLRKQDRFVGAMFDAIAARFSQARSGWETWSVWKCFEQLWPCPKSHEAKIINVFEQNPEAMKSTKAVPALRKWKESLGLGAGVPVPVPANAAFPDDLDPFAED